MLNTIKHIQRRNDKAVRTAQKHAMSYLYSTLLEAQAAWESRQGVEMMPEIEDCTEEQADFEIANMLYADR